MTSELAKLLDGEVAARFGRPDVGWDYGDAPDEVADALWLAHLWIAIGVRQDSVSILPHTSGWIVSINDLQGNVGTANQPSLLEALCRAMLAVPETKP